MEKLIPDPTTKKPAKKTVPDGLWDVLLILVLLIAAIFRFTGIEWDGNQHLHPDERFLTMVETAIQPADTFRDYFDTSTSSLNPNNQGYTFYVYGTLPIFIVRYIGEWVGMTGYDQINIVGRVLSGIFDLGTIVLIYFIGRRLYRHPRLSLLGALFSALAVLQIQVSHYFTVDNFANFFTYAAIYVAVHISTSVWQHPPGARNPAAQSIPHWMKDNWSSAVVYGIFGLLYGMALASKVSSWALAALLPLAAFVQFTKIPKAERESVLPYLVRNLVAAGVVAFFTFRIFQPYTFMGPGFFGLKINPAWLSSLKELSAIQSGEVDVPYALQWARRPATFILKNLVLYGLGLPLGILSLGGLVWMGWRMIKGDWSKHVILWAWTVFVLVTQSLAPVKSMRYVLSVYPALALIAAWAVYKLIELASTRGRKLKKIPFNSLKSAAYVILALVIAGSTLWATAFTSIYTKPVTRVAASDWIYENVPGAINLTLLTEDGKQIRQPLAYQNGAAVASDNAYRYRFEVAKEEILSTLKISNVYNLSDPASQASLLASIYEIDGDRRNFVGGGFLQSNFVPVNDPNGDQAELLFQQPASLLPGVPYELEIAPAESGIFLRIAGAVDLGLEKETIHFPPPVYRLTSNSPYQLYFSPCESGVVAEIDLNRVVDLMETGEQSILKIDLVNSTQPDMVLASGQLSDGFLAIKDPRGEQKIIRFDQPVRLQKGTGYTLYFSVQGSAELGIYNSITAIESSWDDALPVNLYGYNTFGFQDGIYGNHLNLELYWDDDAEKLERLTSALDQTDAIFISSNRQWGTIPRVPERYPLTTEYYRALIGCPAEKDLLWCYSVAKPGMFTGELGFELAAVFQNDPQIGNWRINDQFAEEAFTVYDHPKVLIFRKTTAYDGEQVKKILGAVDLSEVVHKTPKQAGEIKGNLMLSEKARSIQEAGGTWVDLFPPDSLLNRYPWFAVVVWYLVIALLGWMAYPLVRIFLKGLPDHGYAFSRLVGMLLLAYFTWLAGSVGIAINRLTISGVFLVILAASAVAAYRQRKALKQEFKQMRRYILIAEGLFLIFFLIDLMIRVGNPDLWHPWKGGEKPMDLSYFTAVLKSTVFPPYDPWYSGGYINYYYYGYVIVGMPVKWLGIEPQIAYNLILPTLFSLTGIGAFGIGWNLFSHHETKENDLPPVDRKDIYHVKTGYWAGLSAAIAVLIAGNLGTLRMIWQGFQRLGSPTGFIEGSRFFESFGWFFSGLGKFIAGGKLPIGYGEWYWNPSRALPGDVITEFPFFTFTYADLHAHMIALPVTLLVLGWALAVLFRDWPKAGSQKINDWAPTLVSLLFGAFVISTLRPTNTWDLPTYLLFGAMILFYAVFRYSNPPQKFLSRTPDIWRRLIFAGGMVLFLVFWVMIFYLPFTNNYGQAYGSITVWKDGHSPLGSYLVHWGWQLFLILTWVIWETREWLSETPASAIQKIKPYIGFIEVLALLFALVLIFLTLLGIQISWLVGILGIWVAILLFRPKLPDSKRLILFMTGTGLLLTLFVELFALEGDVGRMNTVFKFYYQAWILLGISASASLIWVIPAVTSRWKSGIANAWQMVLVLLLFGVFLYPLTASMDKIRDRMSDQAPAGLVGDTFMLTSVYNDQGTEIDLSQDYQGIEWMRKNVKGSPVIVEANTVEYRWGNRYTIYTGLPGVLGWNWHQRQQRGFLAYNGIANRLNEIPNFYLTTNIEDARSFLSRYRVKYIILGQLERAYYNGDGLNKFTQYDGVYWKEVFRYQDTTIYEVLDASTENIQ
ncbi:MAG: hypothetical protein KBG10_05455 [Anaerolineaceae bacterium]|nr:hypothetical protein [Anaerolineaceae bacterium]